MSEKQIDIIKPTVAEMPDGLIGKGFFAMKGNFPFIDIGTPESFRLASDFFASPQ